MTQCLRHAVRDAGVQLPRSYADRVAATAAETDFALGVSPLRVGMVILTVRARKHRLPSIVGHTDGRGQWYRDRSRHVETATADDPIGTLEPGLCGQPCPSSHVGQAMAELCPGLQSVMHRGALGDLPRKGPLDRIGTCRDQRISWNIAYQRTNCGTELAAAALALPLIAFGDFSEAAPDRLLLETPAPGHRDLPQLRLPDGLRRRTSERAWECRHRVNTDPLSPV